MKLVKLINCDIYRDGGSFEGIWLTDDNKEWAVTLLIVDWDDPKETRHYTLFNCKRNEVDRYSRIEKDSKEHKFIMATINDWVNIKEHSVDNGRLDDLLTELNNRNY
jgi:hypothetical protein